jgi:nucleotide-binding universal stress UspA family protein
VASTTVSNLTTIKNVLFVTDFSPASRLAVSYMIALATRYKSKVTLIHALGAVPFTPLPYEQIPPILTNRKELFLPQMEQLRKECIANALDVSVAVKDGDITDVVGREFEKQEPTLVVLGTHAHGGFHRMLLGSHAEQIARRVKCGVLLVGPHATGAAHWRDRISRILVATDFEDGSHHALDFIAPLAAEHRSEVMLLHVVDEPTGIPIDLAELEEHASARKLHDFVAGKLFPIVPRLEVRLGHPHQEIIAFANRVDADLIVLGRRKGGFFAEHKPSTTLALVTAMARCPVLTFS